MTTDPCKKLHGRSWGEITNAVGKDTMHALTGQCGEGWECYVRIYAVRALAKLRHPECAYQRFAPVQIMDDILVS